MLRGGGVIVHERDNARGETDSLAFSAAVAKDAPVFHSPDDMLHSGAHPAVAGVVFFLPGHQIAAGFLSMGYHTIGSQVSTVSQLTVEQPAAVSIPDWL